MIQRIQRRLAQLSELLRKVDDLQKAVGRLEARLTEASGDTEKSLREYEFRVYSQWGEDGIIQHLIRRVPIANPVFVEFGVQDYKESNTRFLLQNDNWSGVVMDSSAADIETIRGDMIYYRHNLRAVCAFIERENINRLLTENGISGDIGLLSIDIDGNDYWIWQAIECVSPRIVICEYDNLLGCTLAVVSPYDRLFEKTKAHYSYLYGGASLPALARLGNAKGYSLVGSNSAGNNAFFVRNDLLGTLRPVLPQETFARARFRNSRDTSGKLTFLGYEESLALIADMPLLNLDTGMMIHVRDIPHSPSQP
jgi:hypothetical protein